MSFTAKVLSEKSRLYCLQYDTGTPDECYFFLLVDAPKEQAFLRAIEQGAPNKIQEFGRVVASGWGEPGAGVRDAMTRQYGITFNSAA